MQREKREAERERERERERQRDTQRDRETERGRERQREAKRERQRERETERERESINDNDKGNIVKTISNAIQKLKKNIAHLKFFRCFFTSNLNVVKIMFLFLEFGEYVFAKGSFVDVCKSSEYSFEYVQDE